MKFLGIYKGYEIFLTDCFPKPYKIHRCGYEEDNSFCNFFTTEISAKRAVDQKVKKQNE